MAGPSGAGAAQDYMRGLRASQIQGRRPKRLGPFRSPVRVTEREVEQLPFPAAWWCGECGYLLPPSARSSRDVGDPMRRAVLDFDGACPHCGEHGWVDLGVVPLAMRMRDDETALARRARSRRAGMRLGGASMVGASIVGAASVPSLALAALPLLVAGLALAAVAWVARMPARRWHRPTRTWSRGELHSRGEATGELTTAPLSGRRAIAWVVCVAERGIDPRRRRRSGNDRGWSLVEQHCDALTIAGHRLTRAPVIDVELEPMIPATPAALEWLQARGLDPSDDLRFYEGIVRDGETVALFANTRAAAPICVTTGA
jgi:hypothetical protein